MAGSLSGHAAGQYSLQHGMPALSGIAQIQDIQTVVMVWDLLRQCWVNTVFSHFQISPLPFVYCFFLFLPPAFFAGFLGFFMLLDAHIPIFFANSKSLISFNHCFKVHLVEVYSCLLTWCAVSLHPFPVASRQVFVTQYFFSPFCPFSCSFTCHLWLFSSCFLQLSVWFVLFPIVNSLISPAPSLSLTQQTLCCALHSFLAFKLRLMECTSNFSGKIWTHSTPEL